MSILATHRVKNSLHKTVGFIINSEYRNYYDVQRNLTLIDNLISDTTETIRSKKGTLPVRTIRDVNTEIYKEICQKNRLVRDIQVKLEKWKTHWNSYVLYVTGARQIGKTTEILKFGLKILSTQSFTGYTRAIS